MKKRFVVLFIVLAFFTCTKKDPVSPEKFFGIQGVISESGVAEHQPIENAIVKVGDLCDTTGTDGAYVIQSLKKGNCTLEVIHPEFALFDTSITVNKDIN